MIKGTIKINKSINQVALVLIVISFLSIIGGSYQSVWGQELAPMPTQAVQLTPSPSLTPAISPTPSVTLAISPQEWGNVVPVHMSQLFAIMVVGMTSLKLLLIMIKRDRRKPYEQ